MTDHLQAQRTAATRFLPAGSNKRASAKELVVPQATFDWLRRFQQRAPSPRLDLRYYAEGAIQMLFADRMLRAALLLEAKTAMFEHLALQLGRELVDELHDPQRGEPEVAARTAEHQQPGFGTATPAGVCEGAINARTQGQVPATQADDPPCKALHVGEATFGMLKTLQETNHDPRVGLRYWLEGAVRLLEQREGLHVDWVRHARAAMQAHLQELQQ